MPVVGEGTYGCVHKPSIKCEDRSDIDYKDKLSKVMKNIDANTELGEYEKIDAADKANEFHMPRPVKCAPKLTPAAIKEINKCQNISTKTANDLKLLIMEDGGQNLEEYVQTKLTKENVELLLIEFHRVISGLRVLQANGLIHHDIKPQNIVYNQTKNRVNFIDFGYMTTYQQLIQSSFMSQNVRTIQHWSFPPEVSLLNRKFYMDVMKAKTQNSSDILRALWEHRVKKHFDIFIAYVTQHKTDDAKNYMYTVFKRQFENMIIKDCTPAQYESFAKHSIDTIDSYGLGMSLLHSIGGLKRLIDEPVFNSMSNICIDAISPNVFLRCNIADFQKNYEIILEDGGLLTKHGFVLENHEIKRLEPLALATEPLATEPLPCVEPDTERNPKTKRCTKKCKTGYTRDADFACKPVCAENMERNPITNRCVKICKPDYVRDSKFRCTRRRSNGVEN